MLFVVGAAVGTVLGTLEIALVAYADHAGQKGLSGVLIAGLAWIGTALALGVAVGASVAGKVVDLAGAGSAFLVATAAAGVAARGVGLCQGLLRVPAEHAGSPAMAR